MGKKPLVIAVNAVVGGGKTTIANALSEKLGNARTIRFDDYHDVNKNIADIHKWIADGADYDLWTMDSIIADINELLEEAEKSGNIDYIILDYPFGYKQKQIAGFINLSIFIDTPFDIALARLIIRDISPQTKTDDIIKKLNGYLSTRSDYHYSQAANKDADLKIDGSLSVDIITDIIVHKIQEFKF